MKQKRFDIDRYTFELEENAHAALKEYINDLERYYLRFEEGEELLAEIRDRMIEILLEGKAKHAVLPLSVVQDIISQIGTVEQFEKEINDQLHRKEAGPRGRLYRDLDNKLIGGVAAGVANYFKIDATWVRIIVALMMLSTIYVPQLGGFSLLGYIILWFIVPGEREKPESFRLITRLYRSQENQIIAGVAGGMANYFRIDPLLIRIAFLILAFSGVFILVYIVLCIIIPIPKNYIERTHTGKRRTSPIKREE